MYSKIIIKPVLTEKMAILQERENKHAFLVSSSANKTEIKKIVYDLFGLRVDVKTLDSDRDQNYYLYTICNEEFVLKIYNANESIDIINLQTNVLDHFQKNDSKVIAAPKIIKTKDGKFLGIVKKK